MRIRTLTPTGDWTFGKGRNNYKDGREATAQDIQTRLKSFLGDCFFNLDAGVDWFRLNGGKGDIELKLQISATILNTQNVQTVDQITFVRGQDRSFFIQYRVTTTYGIIDAELSEDDLNA